MLAVLVLLAVALNIAAAHTPIGHEFRERSGNPVAEPNAASPPLLGISVNSLPSTLAGLDHAFADIRSLGFQAVRIDISWVDVQPRRSRWHWVTTDRIVRSARANGLRVLGVLAYTPAWAREPGCTSSACPPKEPQAFADFARAVAARYGHDSIPMWEIWNEPNVSRFWEPRPDAASYAHLLDVTSAAIHSVSPDALVASAGLAAVEHGNRNNIPQLTFLDRMLATGSIRSVDAIAYHPYTYPYPTDWPHTREPRTAWNVISQTRRSVSQILAKHGAELPIWVTEYGAPTDGPGVRNDGRLDAVLPGTDHVSERWQSELAVAAVKSAAKTRGVRAFFWYGYQDFTFPHSNEGSYGLRREDGTPKPALAAIRHAIGDVSSTAD